MLAARTRSGLEETFHDGAVAVFDAGQRLTAWSGDIDRPFYLRSSAKPFQAFIAQEAGASLNPIELAMAAASHDGYPAHVAIVRSMLEVAGLSDDDLQCPPDWPLGQDARHHLVGAGHRVRRRIWHNCSGKHAAWVRACRAQDWPLDTYLDPGHPLQTRIRDLVTDLGEFPTTPVGVDGCGAPVLRTTVRAMALMFSRLATEDRFAEVFSAMHRYPALVSGVGRGDTAIARATNSVAKRGAAGCIGVALHGQWGVGAKAWDGSDVVATVGAAAALSSVGGVSDNALAHLEPVSRPEVFGGGKPVGHLESRLELNWP